MTKDEKFAARIGKVIEKVFRMKLKDKDGKSRGYLDVHIFGFAEDSKAQMSLERSINWIENSLPK